jgi:hypothetical protein
MKRHEKNGNRAGTSPAGAVDAGAEAVRYALLLHSQSGRN